MGSKALRRALVETGGKIRALRLERHWRLRDLSRATGISVTTLHMLEKGKQPLGLEHMVPIAGALEVEPATLLATPRKPNQAA